MDEELGGLDFEDLSDEGIARFLRDNIGDDIDTEMMEEFRSSNIFDEFLQQLQVLPPNSRRASLANSDGQTEIKTSPNNIEGQHPPQELAVPSTSKNSPVPPKADSERSKQQKKKSSKSTAEAPNLQEQREIPKSERKPKKHKNVQPESPAKESIQATAQTSKKNKSSTKLCSPSSKNDTGGMGVGIGGNNERREAHNRKKQTLENLTLEKPKPIVRLYDLVMMKNFFPNGLSSHMVVTSRLVEEIQCWERQVLSLEASKKCLKNVLVSSQPSSEDRSKHIMQVESDGNKSRKTSKKNVDKVPEDIQEKKKSDSVKSSSKNEVKHKVDSKQKAPSVVSFAKGSNALGILHWAVKPNPSRNDKTAKSTQSTSTAIVQQEPTPTSSNPPDEAGEGPGPTIDCTGGTSPCELADIGLGVDCHVKFPPLQRLRKIESPSDDAVRVDNPVLPHPIETAGEPQNAPNSEAQGNTTAATVDCETTNKDCNENVKLSLTVHVVPDDSPQVECQSSNIIDEQVASPPAIHGELESPSRLNQEKNNENETATLSPALYVESTVPLDPNESKTVSEKGPPSPVEPENSFRSASAPLDPQESINISENMPSSLAVPEEPIISTPMESQEITSMKEPQEEKEEEKVASPAIPHLEPESPPTLACQENETEDSAFEAIDESHNLSPDDMSEGQDSVSPEETTVGKSASSERTSYKRKNVIESSSDDDIKRIDTDDMDEDREPKKSSDEEQRKSLPFERKRDQADPRSKKFDRFEHERQRKLGEKKKGKEKPKETVALEEVLKEKPLTGSFRIPKRTTNARPLPRAAMTPLASTDIPKENLQFERCRKGADKEKWDKDFNYRGRDYNRDSNSYQDYNNDSGGINVVNPVKKDQEPGNVFRNWPRDKEKDDGRVVLLAPETTQIQDPSPPNSPAEPAETEPEVQWGNDSEEVEEGGSSNSAPSSDNEKYFAMEKLARREPEPKPTSPTPNSDAKDKAESEAGEEQPGYDPEVPIEAPQSNPIAVGAVYLVTVGDKIDLPNVETLELRDVIVMKLAWWLSRIDPENAFSVDTRDSICDDKSDDGSRSFLHKLNFTESDEEDLFPRGFKDPRKKQPYMGLVDEHCGNALLEVPAKYRTGAGDKFENIFQVRKGANFAKGIFQAWCTLCSSLVVGKKQLADHVSGDIHKAKMSKAAGGDIKSDIEAVCSDKKNGDTKVELDKIPKVDETTTSSKEKETEGSRSRSINENRDRKKDEDIHRRDRSDKHVSSSEKRKRSKDGTSDEGGHKSKEDTNKSGDKSERRHSRSGGNRSRSRSPRHKRTRSRSPRRRSPRSGHRRRSRSIQRIPRSPTRLAEQRERRRSTSAERVQKFLAKTNRRSRSPSSKGYSNRKRHRRSRSKSPITEHVLPRRDNREFHEKLMLTAEGKWTAEMEQRWKLMEADQAMFMEQFGEKKTMLNDTPESHPNYKEEWTSFWEKRYTEVQNEGLDPEEYDFVPEWKDCWTKRLRELLDLEYEGGTKEIKEKHGMDLDSLHKIRLVKEANKTVSPAPDAPQTYLMSPPQDLATPSTPSSASLPPSNQISLQQPYAKSSNISGNGDDYTARSMSISDGGDGDNRSDRSTNMLSPNGIAGSKAATTTVSDVMSTWAKLKSGEFGQQPPTMSSVSRSKPTDNISNADSGSIASFDFDGFELTQVLHLMSQLEDQLSFFSDKVKEYFKKAEELDLKKKNKSYTLLDDEDFVVMLFNVRDRFMAMIRANVLAKDILKSLNFTVYALNSILDAPQCRKHRSKIATSNVPFESEKPNEAELPKVANTQPTGGAPVSSAASRTRNPSMSFPSSTKAKIAVLITEFLQNMGREDLSDAELRELLRKVLPPRVKNNANALRREGDSILAGSNSYCTNDLRNVTKTCSVVTERVVGSAVPSLTLPDVIVPVPVSAHDRGPLGCREEVWGNNFNRESDNNVSSSESERRCGSPFSRRGFTGNPTSNPFRDKDTLSLQSSVQTEHETEYRISAIDDMLPDKHTHTATQGHGIGKRRKDPEIITLDQVTTKSARTQEHSSREGSPSRPNISRLVTGLSYIIMKDKNTKNPTPKKDQSPPLTSDEDTKYYRRERVKKKRKRKRERRHASRSSSSSNASYHAEREYKRERKKRRRRKDENKHRPRKSSVVTDEKARASTSTIRIAPTEHSDDSYSASLRESNRRNRRTSSQRGEERYQTVSPESVAQVEIEEPYQSKSRHNVKINMPKTFRLTTLETLSDISSLGDGIKQVSQENELPVPSSNHKTSDNDRNKVESVSKAFWTADAEDNERALLSPVSSNDNEPQACKTKNDNEPANAEPQSKKLSRQYRVNIEKVEREPGEISDSSCSQDS